mgnify:CR=1 FL=1
MALTPQVPEDNVMTTLLPQRAPAEPNTSRLLPVLTLVAVFVLPWLPGLVHAADTSPQAQLQRLTSMAGSHADAERGRRFFTSRHGGEWSCSSCHGAVPVRPGKHASTGKVLDPLAPAANPLAFTSEARVDKWFRRNCKDVLSRECTPGEKADVLAWLISLKP